MARVSKKTIAAYLVLALLLSCIFAVPVLADSYNVQIHATKAFTEAIASGNATVKATITLGDEKETITLNLKNNSPGSGDLVGNTTLNLKGRAGDISITVIWPSGVENEVTIRHESAQSGTWNIQLGSTHITELLKGTLTITKDITGDILPEELSEFTFTITGPNNYSNSVTITGEDSETIDLEPGVYTVTEEAVNNYTPDKNPQSATITAGGAVTLTFTNTYDEGEEEPTTGELTIKKVITGDTPEEPSEFTFTITPIATAYRMDLDDNSDLVKITGSGTKTCTLEPGEYIVSEIDVPDNYKIVGKAAEEVTITAGETEEVTFTNRYEKPSDNGGGDDNNDGGGGGKRNRPPRAIDDEAKVDQGSEVNIRVLANDWDPDGDRISIKSFTQGENGQVSLNDNGTLEYIPNADFTGTDTFTYTIKDTKGATDTATVTVVVNSPAEKPEEPGIPDKPIEEPEKPVTSEPQPEKPEDVPPSEPKGELPRTGGNYYLIMALGVALLAVGISLRFASRKA